MPKATSEYDTKFIRILRLFYLLQSDMLVSVEEVAKELGITPRTAYRYIKELKKAGVVMENRSGYNGGSRIVDVPPGLRDIDTTPEEDDNKDIARELIIKEYENWIKELTGKKQKLKKAKDELVLKAFLKGKDPKQAGKNSKLTKINEKHKKINFLLLSVRKRLKSLQEPVSSK